VWTAVVAPADEIGGHYCENCHVGNIVPDDVPIGATSEGVRGYALDPNIAEALWKRSEELVGNPFSFLTRRNGMIAIPVSPALEQYEVAVHLTL